MLKHAFTTIVAGPGHLVGTTAQVAQVAAGKKGATLPPLFEEYEQLLGREWAIQILESPSDVGRFYRAAQAMPEQPRVGLISYAKLKLGSGVTLGAENREADALAERLWIYLTTLLRSPHLTPERRNTLEARFASPDVIAGLLLKRDARVGTHDLEVAAHEAAIKAAKKAEKQQLEASVNANADAPEEDDESEDTARWHTVTYTTVSGETRSLKLARWKHRRDQLLRHTDSAGRQLPPLLRSGLCCPTCGRRLLTSKGDPQTEKSLKRFGLAVATCTHCGTRLGQMSREQDNVADRTNPLWDSADWQAVDYDDTGSRSIPWGERPRSNPRYALGPLIARCYPNRTNLFISDEVHECKGANTSIAQAFGAMVSTSEYAVGMTGTLYGGYASTLYYLLLRMGNRLVRDRWGWEGKAQFIHDVGVEDVISREVERRDDAGHFSGRPKVEKDVRERAGVTAELANIVQNHAYSVLLKHMGFNLVEYTEDMVALPLPPAMEAQYRAFEASGKEIIARGGYDALSSYLQGMLTWPYQPWRKKVVSSKMMGLSTESAVHPEETTLPHHEYLAQFCASRIKQGRRVLLFAEHTGLDDICTDIKAKVTQIAQEQHGVQLKVGILRSNTVPSGERARWFSEREADGTNVVICNPRLVKTGLNLIGWPSIVVLEPVYSLYDLFQAKRRAFRPTQTRDCEVVFVCYRRTMSERALGVIARKAGAAAILSGDDLSGGLLEFDPGMSLLQELAKSVTQGDGDAMNEDVRAMLQDAARKFKQSMENGHADMLGVDPMALPMNQPAVSTPPATLIATDCFETPVDEALMPIPVPAATLGLFKTVSVQTLVTGKGSKKAAPAPAVTHEQWVMDL